jgi:predicted dehydrogenase
MIDLDYPPPCRAAAHIRIRVIGLGMVGQLVHLPAIDKTLELELLAIADLDEILASRITRRYGVAQVHSIHTSLLNCPEVDAVVIVTHRNVTASVVKDALQRGKHVLSEKPMAMTLAFVHELVDLASQKGLVYGAVFSQRQS